jgi:hypothetical protein
VGDLAVGAEYDDDGGSNHGALWILFLASDGSVLAEQKISQTAGGFTGALTVNSQLGRKLAAVGDLDGDGRTELAVLSRAPNRLWILFLAADGTVTTTRENLFTDPVFGPGSAPEHFYYADMDALGDLDGDGLGDLAIGAPRDSDGFHEAGAVWIARMDADGSFKAAHKISQTQGGFTGTLYEEGYFGIALEHLGDLDGDGNRELAVLSPYGPPFGGTMWVLRLDANELVTSQVGFEDFDDYGLLWPNLGEYAAWRMAWLGDIDGDGDGELAQGFPYTNFPGGDVGEGGITIGSVESDGSILKRVRISNERGGFGPLARRTDFGYDLAPLGDLDGDGLPELAVGAPSDRTATLPMGGLWIVSLDTDAARNGAGTNPVTLSQTDEPVFGTPWSVTLDCSAHAPGLALVFARSAPLAGQATPFGELLVGGHPLFALQAVHASAPIVLQVGVPPLDIALLDLPLFVQGLCDGAPGLRLGNALDVLVGR